MISTFPTSYDLNATFSFSSSNKSIRVGNDSLSFSNSNISNEIKDKIKIQH